GTDWSDPGEWLTSSGTKKLPAGMPAWQAWRLAPRLRESSAEDDDRGFRQRVDAGGDGRFRGGAVGVGVAGLQRGAATATAASGCGGRGVGVDVPTVFVGAENYLVDDAGEGAPGAEGESDG